MHSKGVSLIIGTLGRDKELVRLLESLKAQTYKNFEIILVDQNSDDRVDVVLSPFCSCMSVKHCKTLPGLSKARNLGLLQASFPIVGFPDDDSWYSSCFLMEVVDRFDKQLGMDVLTGITVGKDGKPGSGKWDLLPGRITLANVWRRGNSATLMARLACFYLVGGFDEKLGVGSGTPWGSGEETDWLIRCIETRMVLNYDPGLKVFHEEPVALFNQSVQRRALSYGRGMGAVYRKHSFPLVMLLKSFTKPIIGSIFFFGTFHYQKGIFYLNTAKGRISGYLCWK